VKSTERCGWENTQSAIVCSSAGDGFVYGFYENYLKTAETVRYVAIVKRKVVISLSQGVIFSGQLFA